MHASHMPIQVGSPGKCGIAVLAFDAGCSERRHHCTICKHNATRMYSLTDVRQTLVVHDSVENFTRILPKPGC